MSREFGMSFSQALDAMKVGEKVSREAWGDAWVAISGLAGVREVSASHFWNAHNAAFAAANGGSATVNPYITLKSSDGCIEMGWVPTQRDMLANDWKIL